MSTECNRCGEHPVDCKCNEQPKNVAWSPQNWAIRDLKPSKKNPRSLGKNDAQQLKRSLEKFGTCEPIVLNTDGTIIGGHQRVKTLKRMGHTHVDATVSEEPLTDLEVDELSIRLNRNHGEFDFDILANEWEWDSLLDWGFLPDELGNLLDDDKDEEEKEEYKCPTCGKKSKKPL